MLADGLGVGAQVDAARLQLRNLGDHGALQQAVVVGPRRLDPRTREALSIVADLVEQIDKATTVGILPAAE